MPFSRHFLGAEHPNDIDVVHIVPANAGKGQCCRALKLHRKPLEDRR
jgi:hypothetical protein